MYLPYSPGERAAWAMKPFWGLHENLLPETDLLEGSLEAVILLVAHAFRLGLTLSVAALYPLEEFLARPSTRLCSKFAKRLTIIGRRIFSAFQEGPTANRAASRKGVLERHRTIMRS